MTPVICRVKHDPENGTYGDCVRACIATILDMDGDDVPHFYHDDCDGVIANGRIADFLRPLGLAPFWINYPGNLSRDDILAMMAMMNTDTHYLLFGATESGDHVVVCRGGEVIHNPSWYPTPLVSAGSHTFWTVLVLARS